MGERSELSKIFESILGSKNVYFEPPENVKLKYPCVVYSRDPIETRFAGNKPYLINQPYSVTLIYLDPDSDLPLKLASLPMCRNTSNFVSDNLHHANYKIYY